METKNKPKEWKENLVSELRLLTRIIGFFLLFYGFLVLIDSSRYATFIPETYSPLLGFLIMAFGVFLIMTKGASRRGR